MSEEINEVGGEDFDAEPKAEEQVVEEVDQVEQAPQVDESEDMPEAVGGEQSEVSREEAIRKRIAELEQEGDIAADYLEELLDITDLGGEFDIYVENDRATVEIVAEDGEARRLQRLVGRHGQVLDSLQELTRLAVQAKTGERSRLMLDIVGHRAKRRQELRDIAMRAVREVEETGESVALKPMNPFERKVCHDTAAEAGLVSESEGVEPNRHVVILPADDE